MAPKGTAGEWQEAYAEIKLRGEHILESGEWSDCCFQFGADDPALIKAHKLILAMASPVFGAMFYGGVAQKDDQIAIVDIKAEIFKILLQYIYTDKINIASFDVACDLYYAAKKYIMPHLVKDCIQYISSNLSPKNACRTYEFACMYDETELIKDSLQVIGTKTQEVLTEPSFMEAELDTVKKIVTMDPLNLDSELDLLMAVSRYANDLKRRHSENLSKTDDYVNMSSEINNCEQDIDMIEKSKNDQEADVPSNNETAEPASSNSKTALLKRSYSSMQEIRSDNETKSDEVAPKIRSLLEQIRFLTMTPQELAESSFLSSLLTNAELFAISMNVASRKTYVPMPAGLSSSRVPRYQKPSANKEKCRNFLANLLDISSRDENKSLEKGVRELIQKLIDAQVQPEEFGDRLERLLNASPQPGLHGFLKNNKERTEATFRFVINNASKLKRYESTPIFIRNQPWAVQVRPGYDTGDVAKKTKHIGIFLCLLKNLGCDWSCQVAYEFKFFSSGHGNVFNNNISHKVNQVFTRDKNGWGRKFEWDLLLSGGHLLNDTLTCEVHIAPGELILLPEKI